MGQMDASACVPALKEMSENLETRSTFILKNGKEISGNRHHQHTFDYLEQ